MQKIDNFLSNYKIAIFPSILLILLLVLTIFKISGTSIGIYHEYLYGNTKSDSSLLYGKPQSIRSDEWLVNTQVTIAQEKNNYQRINNNFNSGKDVSMLVDAPYKDWSTLFKPQHFSFFVLPLEHAFAFKWWFLLFALMSSVYFFSLKLLPGKVWLAIFASITLACSPFVFWWYQTGTIATLCYAFLILLIGMSIIENKKMTLFKKEVKNKYAILLRTVILSYLLIAFAMVLYPPFQIPVAIVAAFFLLGYLLNHITDKTKKDIYLLLMPFFTALLLTGGVLGAYITERYSTIETVNSTVYPGKRVVSSGGYDIKKLLVVYLQPQLQREDRGSKYLMNQSEASNFLLLPIFFIIPAITLFIALYFKNRKIDWLLLSLITCTAFLMSHLFIPGSDIITRLLLLHLVPHDRVIIGLGFIGTVLLLYLVRTYEYNQIVTSSRTTIFIAAYILTIFSLMIWSGIETSKEFPEFISNKILIVLLASILTAGLAFILLNRLRIGMTIIALFSLSSVAYIHPLYVGLGPIYNNEITSIITNVSDRDDIWAAAQDIRIENLPQMNGRAAVTGISAYPDPDFWKEYSNLPNDTIYNRYAHTFLSANDSQSLILVAPDLYAISGSCARRISEKIDYIVSVTPLEGVCNKLIKTLKYPNVTFYFYKQ
jgi:hypothetical protein